jgi:membrane-associated phospholipid phosphatase
MTLKTTTAMALASLPLTALAWIFLDQPVAWYFHDHLLKDGTHFRIPFEVPDLLLPIAVLATAVAWLALFLFRGHPGHARARQCFRLIGITTPVAFVLKSVAKFLVGRINTRFWLAHPAAPQFHWLHGVDPYVSLPSGHMVVFTVLAAALAVALPRHRRLIGAGLALLALALLATNNHFLSDVLAGTGLGLAIHAAVAACTPPEL